MKTKEQIEAHRRTCEHFNTTLLEMVKRVAQPTCVPYLRGKTQEVMVRFTPVETIARL